MACGRPSTAWCQEDFPSLTIPGLGSAPPTENEKAGATGDQPAPAYSESRPSQPGDEVRIQQRLKPGEREFLPRPKTSPADPDPPAREFVAPRSSGYGRQDGESESAADALPDVRRVEDASRFPIVNEVPAAGDVAVSVRSAILNRFIEDQKVESDNVATRVLEADVRGVQTTATFVRLESAQSPQMARLNVIAQGNVNSNTVGYTPQARVTTAGNHTFNVVKPVYFDGRRFLTKPAYGGLQVRQTPQMVNTRGSGMPLFGPIGDQIAWNEVLRRMPESDAIVVRRVADDVFPRVNRSVDQQLTDLNRKWGTVRQTLSRFTKEDRLRWAASSTTDSFTTVVVNESVAVRTHDPGNGLTPELSPVEAAAILLSEDGVNHFLNGQSLNGLTITDRDLQQLVADHKSGTLQPATLPDRLVALQDTPSEPLLFALKLSESQPVGLRFRDGRLQLQLRFQILPKAGAPSVTQLMTVQLKGRGNSSGGWALFVSDISIQAASTNEQPDTWTDLIDGQIGRVIELIPQTELPRQIDLAKYADNLPSLRIHRIQAIGGQLRVSFRTDEPAELTSRRPRQ